MMPTDKSGVMSGLTAQEVEQSRLEHGENILTPPARESVWRQFLSKFRDPLIVILLVAGFVSILISIYEYVAMGAAGEVFIEPVGIFMAILLATGLGFYFEHAAEKEFEVLNKMSDDQPVQVVRDGNTTSVPRREVVVDDVVMLNTGDEVPADGVLLRSVRLAVDESTLTGSRYARSRQIPSYGIPTRHFRPMKCSEVRKWSRGMAL